MGVMRVKCNEGSFPSFEEGAAAPIKQMRRYLKIGVAGEVRHLLQHASDLSYGCALSRLRFAPGRADFMR